MSRKPRPLVLSESECQQLAHIAERSDDWRARQRSRTLLMLHRGKPINAVAAEQGIDRDTVAVHRDAWLAKGVDGLFDAPAVVHRTNSQLNTSRSCATGPAQRR